MTEAGTVLQVQGYCQDGESMEEPIGITESQESVSDTALAIVSSDSQETGETSESQVSNVSQNLFHSDIASVKLALSYFVSWPSLKKVRVELWHAFVTFVFILLRQILYQNDAQFVFYLVDWFLQ